MAKIRVDCTRLLLTLLILLLFGMSNAYADVPQVFVDRTYGQCELAKISAALAEAAGCRLADGRHHQGKRTKSELAAGATSVVFLPRALRFVVS